MRSLTFQTLLLGMGLFWGATSLQADVIRIDFDATVTSVVGDVPPDASLGSPITGYIQIDLATLPPLVPVGEVGGRYHYLDRSPGYSMQVTVGQSMFAYDSVNASQEGGPTPGISLEPEYASLIFVLREQGNPFVMSLGLFDYSSSANLLSGPRFPDDVDLSLAGLEFGTFGYYNVDHSIIVGAEVIAISMYVIPEPRTSVLAALIAMVLVWRKCRTRRSRQRLESAAVPIEHTGPAVPDHHLVSP
jgi:hypothetical protein